MDVRFPSLEQAREALPNLETPLQLLIKTGVLLARERNLDVILQAALDAGLQLSHAGFGVFRFSRGEAAQGRPSIHASGNSANAFAAAPETALDGILSRLAEQREVLRSADISQDSRYAEDSWSKHLLAGKSPIRSFLAVPVVSRSGKLLGAMLYGDSEPDRFGKDCEELVTAIAAQAALAIDNVRLADGLDRETAHADAARSLQQESERENSDTSRRLRQALDAGQLGTWTWDKNTDLLDLDERAAQIFGVPPHVPVSRTALRSRAVFPDDLAATPEDLNDLLAGGVYKSEYRVDRPEGFAWVSSRGLATMSEDGTTVIGMTGTIQDITAQKNQESLLRQTEKLAATGRMAATIAHEINNPLEAVTNLIYLSKTDARVPSDIQHLLELADTELARVSQIAQQTLGFYRDTSHPVDIDLSGLLHGVADLFSRKLEGRNLRIDMDVRDNLHIFGLQGEVRQVFSNLMVNAIDASDRGKITVRARSRCCRGIDGVAVMICDEGAGIPQSVRPKLFVPFFTTKQAVGTGLGLWVTRGIVEKSGGRVGFRSRTDPPTGTVFRVFLPSGHDEKATSLPPQSTILQ